MNLSQWQMFQGGCAEEIVKIKEIKGVLFTNQKFSSNSSDINKLLAGDDFRCGVFPLGNDCIIVCKNQSKVPIEFPRPYNPKVSKIKHLNLKNKVVIDGFCGVGTLGMVALKMGAKKVIFCDINKHAIDNLIYNLGLNFGEEIFERVEIFNADFLDLDVKGDICFVDLFPYMEPDIYLKKAKEIANEVIVI